MPTASEQLSVYVVEDSKMVVGLLERAFQADAGARVLGHQGDADAAIQEILLKRPDVVVIDLSLRRGTGYDVLRVISKLAPPLECLVLTNHSTTPYKEAAARLGVEADHFFDKTNDIVAIVRRVQEMAAAKRTTTTAQEAPHEPANQQTDRRRSL
jgi:DNA-binding NarL/FixJ family response regulator